MVRLISIIRQSLQKAAGNFVPRDSDSLAGENERPGEGPVDRPGSLPAIEGQDFAAGSESESRANPYRRKTVLDSSNPLPQPEMAAISGEQDLYRELVAAARFALNGTIVRDRIELLIGNITGAFEREPYNGLLLVSYSFSRQDYLPAHIANNVILTVAFARSLGYGRQDMIDLGLCAFGHDLGMAGHENSSADQQLSSGAIDDIKQHPLRSAELVRPVFTEKIASVVVEVHERENGQGYPRGIPGSQIHLWAKILAVCDTFEALTHPRNFRGAYSPYEAIKIIIKKKDVLFDHLVVKRFIDFMSIYPVGTLVLLNSGETAIVVAAVQGAPTRPVVRVLLHGNREIEEADVRIDLSTKDFVYVTAVVDPEKEKEILYFLKPRRQVALDAN